MKESDYEKLMERLNPWGFYQKRLYLLSCVWWATIGIAKETIELGLQQYSCPYAMQTSEWLGVLIGGQLSMWRGRKVGNVISAVCMLLSVALVAISVETDQKLVGTGGIFLMGFTMYSAPLNMLTLICEYSRCKDLPILLTLCLLSLVGGKLVTAPVVTFTSSPSILSLGVLLPIGVIQLMITFFFEESPRYLNSTNYIKSEEVIGSILSLNGNDRQSSNNHYSNSFLWEKINIRKYTYQLLLRTDSLQYPSYSLLGCFLLLGLISNYPFYVLSLDERPHSSYFTPDIVVEWVSSFQLVGLLTSLFFMSVYPRKKVAIAMSATLTVISALLLFADGQFEVVLDLSLLALNAFFAVNLFSSLLVNSLEFYPHTVRLLGVSFVISFYYLGSLLTTLYQIITLDFQDILEFYFLSSLILCVHTLGITETINKGYSYEIQEILEESQQQE